MAVLTGVGLPTKSESLLVKHVVAQLSMAIWNESESYRMLDVPFLTDIKQQSTDFKFSLVVGFDAEVEINSISGNKRGRPFHPMRLEVFRLVEPLM